LWRKTEMAPLVEELDRLVSEIERLADRPRAG